MVIIPTGILTWQIFDGHNGISAAIFAKENLLANVLSAVPQGINRDEWLQALPRALVAGFVKTDIEFQQKGEHCILLLHLYVFYFWHFLLGSYILHLDINDRRDFWDDSYICCD
jgi:hypothetical protein